MVDAKAALPPGTRLWSVATGGVSPLRRRSREAARFVAGLDGFMAVFPSSAGTLWLFASEGAAIRARNLMEGRGIACGRNVRGFTVADDGALEMDGPEGE